MGSGSGSARTGPASQCTHVCGVTRAGRGSLFRGFAHHSEVVLGVLVVILGFDRVAGQGGSARELDVSRVLGLWVDALIGPPPSGTGGGSTRAGRGSSVVVALIGDHERGGGLSTMAPCVRADIREGPKHAKSGVGARSREDLARPADYAAPPGRGRLASAADALAGPFAQEWRLADQARLGLGCGVLPGCRLLVVVVHRIVWFFWRGRGESWTLAGRKNEHEDSESTQAGLVQSRSAPGDPRCLKEAAQLRGERRAAQVRAIRTGTQDKSHASPASWAHETTDAAKTRNVPSAECLRRRSGLGQCSRHGTNHYSAQPTI